MLDSSPVPGIRVEVVNSSAGDLVAATRTQLTGNRQ
jgi:hypothetical protein